MQQMQPIQLSPQKKIIITLVILPLMVMIIIGTMSFQLLTRYHQTIDIHIQKIEKDEEPAKSIAELREISAIMMKQFIHTLITIWIVSILIIILIGFFMTRQLRFHLPSESDDSKGHILNELHLLRSKIDALIRTMQ